MISYRREALPRIQLWPIDSTASTANRGDDVRFRADVGGPWRQSELGFAQAADRRESFVTPVRVYDLDLATGERILLREQPVLGDYRPEDYVERRDWALAADGARIPVSIVHRAGIEFPAPALLYGYGAYESARIRASPSPGCRCWTAA